MPDNNRPIHIETGDTFFATFLAIVVFAFLILSEKCGGGLYWRYDGQPHSLVLTAKPQ